MERATKERLLDAGLSMLLERGYNDMGISALLEATEIPKGSFYHHFQNKEDFALQVIDRYMHEVNAGLDACLLDVGVPPLNRVRAFFEATQEKYESDGYLGCMLGGLGQELSGVNLVFRKRIESCLAEIASRITACFDEAKKQGALPSGTDSKHMANLLVDCWEGAALRSRLLRDPAPLQAVLDFYFQSANTPK